MNKNKVIKNTFNIIAIIAITLVFGYRAFGPSPKDISYVEFKQMISSKQIEEVHLKDNAKITVLDKEGLKYKTDNPRKDDFKEYLLNNDVKVKEVGENKLYSRIFSLLSTIITIYIMYTLIKTLTQYTKKTSFEFTKEKENVDVKFDDIAGNVEAKREMQDLIHYIKNSKEYAKKGAKIPKGVILYGPPGTGKTLLAKAVAGEAEVPFYSLNGSEFVELYVGMGARKIRQLFEQARKNSPCVIFIDEFDSVGGKRGMVSNGGDSEREQTINALLTELSGFNSEDGIVVMAATNRLEYLDDALIRNGRFSKKIAVELPSTNERKEILKYYLKDKNIDETIDISSLSKLTIGFSGADISELINEAQLISLRDGREIITFKDIDKAHYKMITQAHEKEDRTDISKKDLKIIAYHEAGHALVSKLLTDESIPKVTVIPTTNGAGGVTFITPNKMGLHSKKDLINRIKVSYGGRVGEYILLEDEELITTGASNDIKQATSKILEMIENYGMSKYGMLDLSQINNTSSNEVLEEATKLSKKFYEETLTLLTEYKDCLIEIADNLMEYDTLYEKELDEIIKKYK